MENFGYRTGARMVAYIDVVLSSVSMFGTILFALITGAVAGAKIKNPDSFNSHPEWDIMFVVMCILIPILALFASIQVWAAVMLLKATRPGAEPILALRRARIWRNVAIIFLGLSIIIDVVLGWFICIFIEVIFRGVLLFFVFKFIEEVDAFVKSGGQQLAFNPTVVMAKV